MRQKVLAYPGIMGSSEVRKHPKIAIPSLRLERYEMLASGIAGMAKKRRI
jgi:hypothetical protein